MEASDELFAAALLCAYLEGYADCELDRGDPTVPDLPPSLLVDHWANATPEQRVRCLGLARAFRRSLEMAERRLAAAAGPS